MFLERAALQNYFELMSKFTIRKENAETFIKYEITVRPLSLSNLFRTSRTELSFLFKMFANFITYGINGKIDDFRQLI